MGGTCFLLRNWKKSVEFPPSVIQSVKHLFSEKRCEPCPSQFWKILSNDYSLGLNPIVGCTYLYLSQSAAVRVSRSTAMLDTCLQEQLGIINSAMEFWDSKPPSKEHTWACLWPLAHIYSRGLPCLVSVEKDAPIPVETWCLRERGCWRSVGVPS